MPGQKLLTHCHNPYSQPSGIFHSLSTHHLSTSSNFFALFPFGEWAFPVSSHLKIKFTLLVGLSPEGLGRGKPRYPEVTLLNLLWPHFSSLALLFFTRSTVWSVCFPAEGLYLITFLGIFTKKRHPCPLARRPTSGLYLNC